MGPGMPAPQIGRVDWVPSLIMSPPNYPPTTTTSVTSGCNNAYGVSSLQPVQSRATNEIVQATRIFPITKMNVEIVRILMRKFNSILLKYQIDRINDQKSVVCLFDACDPSFELLGLVPINRMDTGDVTKMETTQILLNQRSFCFIMV